MKFFISPVNLFKSAPVLIGIDINKAANVMTFYLNSHLTRSNIMWLKCAVKDVFMKFCDYSEPGRYTVLREHVELHSQLHNNIPDRDDILHVHFKFDASLTVERIKEFFNCLKQFQTKELGGNGKPLLLPNIDTVMEALLQRVEQYFGTRDFDKQRFMLNCEGSNSENVCPKEPRNYLFFRNFTLPNQRGYAELAETECQQMSVPDFILTPQFLVVAVGAVFFTLMLLSLVYCMFCNKTSNTQQSNQARLESKNK